jgi:two-component system, sensor histidine kinase
MLTAELLGGALDSGPDAIVIIDSSGRILFANSQVRALLGYEPAEIVGQSVENLLPERLRSRHVTHRAGYSEQPSVRPMGTGLDLYALRRDATEVPVEISLSPIRGNGGDRLVAAALRDATERRRHRLELIEAREAADRANQAKSRFLATASHDLRQPLQSMSLLSGALRRMVKDPTATEALAQQEQAIGAMSRLLNALLDISKLESGGIRPEPSDFAIGTLFEELRKEFSSLAANKGLELRVATTTDFARSDPALVGQILRNLVSNAIKYTATGRVELRCVPAGAAVRVEIRDTGIGIAADQLAHIYDEFYQVGVARNTGREGYGLGLSIVRRLVALLQLRIEVYSEPGHGSIFALELPRGAATGPQRERPAASGSIAGTLGSAPLILLVEDDDAVRGATVMLLTVEGYRVSATASLSEALAHAEPDTALLITDYHLRDGETGAQVIAGVRQALRRELPAVLITGDTSSTIRARRPDDRVHLVSKPIVADQLLEMLKTLLSSP